MDAAEFDAFHAGTYPRLVARLSAATGDPGLAQDSVEHAYARAWAHRRRLGRDEPAETWVLEVAAREARVDPATLPPDTADLDEVQAAIGALPRRPAPVDEVRRRGDRRARSRSVLVALATVCALAVGAVGAVLAVPGGSGGGPGPPEDLRIEEPDPLPERPSEVSVAFDLAAGLSQDGRVGPRLGLEPFGGRQVCGRPYALGGLTSQVLGVQSYDFGMVAGRVLAVAKELDLSDADLNAHGIVERYVERFERCPEDTRDGLTTTVDQTNYFGDESWTVVRQAPDGNREVVQVVRVGSAVLVTSTQNVAGDAIALDSFIRAERYAVAPVVERMCLWDDAGCAS